MGELKYRTRVGIIMDNNILAWLNAKAEESDVPKSRIIEKALMAMYGDEIKNFKPKDRQEEFINDV